MAESNNKLSPKVQNFFVRTLSALVLFPVGLYCFYNGGILFFLAMLVILWLLAYEWSDVCGKLAFSVDGMAMVLFLVCVELASQMGYKVLSFILLVLGCFSVWGLSKIRMKTESRPLTPRYVNRVLFMTLGMGYFGLFALFFAYLSTIPNLGGLAILWTFLCVVASDTFGYLAGISIGGPKLFPKISPKKTWAGFLGSVVGVMLVSYFFALSIENSKLMPLLILSPFIAIVATLGDALESGIKRYLGIKDMSNIIPGHGGVFDRLDALILTSIFTGAVSMIIGKSILLISF